ncbi:GH3 auxin-responsive promoter [marine bacterium AO1-C]|nr:GH3 auxin-responsive promoter [marine bacterium AO1-C]
MPILGKLLKEGIKLRKSIEQEKKTPFDLQKKQLLQLLSSAKQTAFGVHYNFKDIIHAIHNSKGDDTTFYDVYRETVPTFDYDKIYNEWWHRARKGEKDVCWKGPVKYFALSSGTSGSPSKHIPVTKAMVKAIHRTSIRQILSLSNFKGIPSKVYGKGMVMLGGSTHLNRIGAFFEGDLSGITASQIPFWFQHFYKPGKKIAKNTDWNSKLDEIAEKAPKWDVGFVVGVPAWIQIMMEKVIERHNLNNIHEVWPNLMVYTHGGVSFEPYKKGFEKLLGRPITYIETYLASEGFVAFQTHPDSNMRFVLNNGLFYEFVPFNEENFNENGELISNPKTYMIHEIEENKDYAILISTCAGAWRYLIGDTVRLTDRAKSEMIITGRTKHFLSLCGEHLSVDNMNKAIELVAHECNIDVKEFTVAGIPHENLFAHKWYIGTNDQVNLDELKTKLDNRLKELNDDYAVERSAALKEIYVETLPTDVFLNWMKMKGKEGGQNKFPRVLRSSQYQEWEQYLNQHYRETTV